MKINRIILRIGLGIILITTLLCIGFTYYTTLKAPIFLRYCIEAAIPEQADIPNSQVIIQLNYITASSDSRSVIGISFPEAPEMTFSATENGYNASFGMVMNPQTNPGTVYGKYSIRTVYVFLERMDQTGWKGEKILHQAQLQYNDGSSVLADLGTIILYRDETDNQDLVSMNSASSSSDGSASSDYRIKGKVRITSVNSELLPSALEHFDIKINGVGYNEFSSVDIENNDHLSLDSQFHDPLVTKTSYDHYDIRPKLTFLTESGEEGYVRAYNITWRRSFFQYKDVLFYLLGRGVF